MVEVFVILRIFFKWFAVFLVKYSWFSYKNISTFFNFYIYTKNYYGCYLYKMLPIQCVLYEMLPRRNVTIWKCTIRNVTDPDLSRGLNSLNSDTGSLISRSHLAQVNSIKCLGNLVNYTVIPWSMFWQVYRIYLGYPVVRSGEGRRPWTATISPSVPPHLNLSSKTTFLNGI